jgi:hypothetical protein
MIAIVDPVKSTPCSWAKATAPLWQYFARLQLVVLPLLGKQLWV